MKLFRCFIIIVICFQMASQSVSAQPESEPFTLGSYFGFGSINQDFKALNTIFSTSGFSNFDPKITYYKIGVLVGRKSRFVFELNAASLFQEKTNALGKTNTLSGFDLGFELQRNILPFSRFKLSPAGGASIKAYTLYLTDQSAVGSSFVSTLTSLQGQRTVYTNALGVLNLGIKSSLALSKRLNKFNISIQAGYKYQVSEVEWGTDGYLLSDSPQINVGGWYAEVGFLLM